MTENIPLFINTKTNKIIFLLSIVASVIWVIGRTINVYHFVVVGAIFEMLWLPVMGLIIILTVSSLLFWIKDQFNFRSLNLYSFIIVLMTIIYTIFYY